MIYYAQINKENEYYEIKIAKNLHNLSKEIKAEWGLLNEFIYGNNIKQEMLQCGVSFPFIKNGGKIWLISAVEGYLEYNNTRWMSRDIWDELIYINQFNTVVATSNLLKKYNEEHKDKEVINNG